MAEAGVLVLTPWLLQCQSWALGKDEDLAALNQEWDKWKFSRSQGDRKGILALFWFYVTTWLYHGETGVSFKMKPGQTDPKLSFCRRHGRFGYDNQHACVKIPLDFHPVPFRIRDAFVDKLRLGSVAIFEDAGCSWDVGAADQMGKIFDATKNALADANVWVDLLVQSGELTNELT